MSDDLRYNAEHYPDPTAAKAIRSADADPEMQRATAVVTLIKTLLGLLGYELIGRIQFRDKKSGREWK